MDPTTLLSLFDREQRRDLRLPGFTYATTPHTVYDYSLEDAAGYIDYAALDEAGADAEIEARVAFFAARGMRCTWKVFDHDRPADLRQRLAAHGFTIDAPDALLILDLNTAPPGLSEPPAALPTIRRVTDAAGVEQIVRLEEAVYHSPRDWLRQHLLRTLQATPDQLSLFIVEDGGAAFADDSATFADRGAVAAAWVQFYPPSQFARLLGGATLPAYRGRGFYTVLLRTRLAEARRRGVRFLVVDASPMSRPLLAQHGFQFLGYSTRCHWSPAANGS